MAYKLEDQIQSLDELEVPITIEKFIEELPSRYANGNIDKEIEIKTEEDWIRFSNSNRLMKGEFFRKKFMGISLTVSAACCIFIGTGYISPVIAEVGSNIPYLNWLYKNTLVVKTLQTELSETLNNKYPNSIALHVDMKNQKIEVMVFETEEYYNEVKIPIKKLINDTLKERDEVKYELNILNDPKTAKVWKEGTKSPADKEIDRVEEITYKVLEDFGYTKKEVPVGLSSNGKIYIEHIPNTEKRIDEIKNQIKEKVNQENIKVHTIKVYTYDPTLEDRGYRLIPLSNTIANGLMAKKEFKVYGVGASNKFKEYFYISIRTTLLISDPDKEEVIQTIEKTVTDFLQSKEALERIKDDKYMITIYSKENEKLKIIKN